MKHDFGLVEDVQSFVSVPEGSYLCRIAEVREGVTRDGSVRWALRLEVAEGDYAGRTAGWDGLVWSNRGVPRVKRVLDLLGFDVRGELEIESRDLEGRELRAHFQNEEWRDPATGQRVLRLRVPYMGYAPADEGDFAGQEMLRDSAGRSLGG